MHAPQAPGGAGGALRGRANPTKDKVLRMSDVQPAAHQAPGLGAPVTASSPAHRRLLILASLPALRNAEGHWLLPAKFVSGVGAYARHWSGPVVVGLQAGGQPTADLDNRYWAPDALPFELHAVDFPQLAREGGALLTGALVLVTLNHLLHGLGLRCLEQNAILVVNTELSLTTQLQIVRATYGTGLRSIKSAIWVLLNHRRAVREIRTAKGLQCNGTPTFDAFARHSPSPLLYFDNRTTLDQCASPADLDARFESLTRRGRVRLLFSGRLHPIKGVHHLVPVAALLRAQGIPFELWIAGDGPLRQAIETDIAQHGLQEQVRLLGALDFVRDIQPMLRDEIDLFVCPHLQGDPSCTYLETLCAGVPIVGYPNEAWRGLYQRSSGGRLCTAASPAAMADEIGALAGDPGALRQLADRALAFAVKHDFEAEFDRRVDHLRHLCGVGSSPT